jgi:hypothetical protein
MRLTFEHNPSPKVDTERGVKLPSWTPAAYLDGTIQDMANSGVYEFENINLYRGGQSFRLNMTLLPKCDGYSQWITAADANSAASGITPSTAVHCVRRQIYYTAFLMDSLYVDTLHEALNMRDSVDRYSVETTVEFTVAQLETTLASKHWTAVVIPELEKAKPILNDGQKTALRNYVENGGTLIVTGDRGGNSVSMLQDVFAFASPIQHFTNVGPADLNYQNDADNVHSPGLFGKAAFDTSAASGTFYEDATSSAAATSGNDGMVYDRNDEYLGLFGKTNGHASPAFLRGADSVRNVWGVTSSSLPSGTHNLYHTTNANLLDSSADVGTQSVSWVWEKEQVGGHIVYLGYDWDTKKRTVKGHCVDINRVAGCEYQSMNDPCGDLTSECTLTCASHKFDLADQCWHKCQRADCADHLTSDFEITTGETYTDLPAEAISFFAKNPVPADWELVLAKSLALSGFQYPYLNQSTNAFHMIASSLDMRIPPPSTVKAGETIPGIMLRAVDHTNTTVELDGVKVRVSLVNQPVDNSGSTIDLASATLTQQGTAGSFYFENTTVAGEVWFSDLSIPKAACGFTLKFDRVPDSCYDYIAGDNSASCDVDDIVSATAGLDVTGTKLAFSKSPASDVFSPLRDVVVVVQDPDGDVVACDHTTEISATIVEDGSKMASDANLFNRKCIPW